MKKIITWKEINQGESIPKFYGAAYHEPWQATTVCYPIPLNIIVNIIYNVTFWLKCGFYKNYKADMVRKIQTKGWNAGFKEGYASGIEGKETKLKPLGEY